ncbi:secreted protein C-like [Procambarus clarkii]|uniref:secreted protein C-like n=1 Tax=Procambarus clarkii TaxID=6728 RepID=UPI0037437C61
MEITGDTEETAGDGGGGMTAAEETGNKEGATELPERASFLNTITRPPRSPPTSAGGTTPHEEPEPSDAGNAPEAGPLDTRPEGEAETPASSGKCTSATTVVCTTTGATPPSPEGPHSSKSPTSAHAEEESRERLGSGRISSDPEADSATRATPTERTVARRSMAASSTTRGTRPGTGGSAGSTPAPSTARTDGEGAGTGTDAAEEEQERRGVRADGSRKRLRDTSRSSLSTRRGHYLRRRGDNNRGRNRRSNS